MNKEDTSKPSIAEIDSQLTSLKTAYEELATHISSLAEKAYTLNTRLKELQQFREYLNNQSICLDEERFKHFLDVFKSVKNSSSTQE